jgi:hypothetical protein
VSSLSHSIAPPSAQASFDHSVECPPADLIEYRTSERGDCRVIAALVTIAGELAEIDAAAACEDDRTVDLCTVSREIAAYRKATGQPHAVPPRRTPSKTAAPRRAVIKPIKRPARARAVHSHASHGGVRKAADDGGGSSDGGGNPPFHKHEPGAALAGVAL